MDHLGNLGAGECGGAGLDLDGLAADFVRGARSAVGLEVSVPTVEQAGGLGGELGEDTVSRLLHRRLVDLPRSDGQRLCLHSQFGLFCDLGVVVAHHL